MQAAEVLTGLCARLGSRLSALVLAAHLTVVMEALSVHSEVQNGQSGTSACLIVQDAGAADCTFGCGAVRPAGRVSVACAVMHGADRGGCLAPRLLETIPRQSGCLGLRSQSLKDSPVLGKPARSANVLLSAPQAAESLAAAAAAAAAALPPCKSAKFAAQPILSLSLARPPTKLAKVESDCLNCYSAIDARSFV